MLKDKLTMSPDGLTAIYQTLNKAGEEKKMFLHWESLKDVPSREKILETFRTMNGSASYVTATKKINLPGDSDLILGMTKSKDSDEASVQIGKLRIAAPIDKENGRVRFKRLRPSIEKDGMVGFGKNSKFFLKFKK